MLDNAIARAAITPGVRDADRAGGVPSDEAAGRPRAETDPRRAATRLHGLLGPGVALGALGILGFSFSLPATRLAVADLDPWLIAFGRATVAALLAVVYLRATRAPRPTIHQARSLAIVALGVVVGFPLFTSLALQAETAAHGAVVIAFLPAATAVAAVVRAGERPSRRFWLASAAGLVTVLAFIAATTGEELTTAGPQPADLFLLVATVLCAIGYAEGGALSRTLGAAPTICWALVLSAPVTAAVAATAAVTTGLHAGPTAWLGFAYVSVVSMFLGFFAWYAGLARGGVARVGQVQLAQPVLTLVWSALLLGEQVTALTVATALLVLASVAVTQRAR
jgi:drug/metabolite transporter (DMT)-like permease